MTFPEEISFCPEGGPEGGFLKHRKIRFHPASIRHMIYAYSTIIASNVLTPVVIPAELQFSYGILAELAKIPTELASRSS